MGDIQNERGRQLRQPYSINLAFVAPGSELDIVVDLAQSIQPLQGILFSLPCNDSVVSDDLEKMNDKPKSCHRQ
jgi:hypothetical protein